VRPLASTCATEVDFGATIDVDFCHRSGLEVTTIEVDLSTQDTRTHGTERIRWRGRDDGWVPHISIWRVDF
jgi:hypothetical protein